MKEKLILFVIGVLIGAVISTGAFYVYNISSSCNNTNQNTQMNGGTPPSMPNGQTPPDMSNNNNNSTTQESN
ncbi:MAG: hypothetical protein E7160_00905 [Firmicutes bacterium]|nr:hypothetical protein [Bacillota bacterium]